MGGGGLSLSLLFITHYFLKRFTEFSNNTLLTDSIVGPTVNFTGHFQIKMCKIG